jgi:hypothetical protein
MNGAAVLAAAGDIASASTALAGLLLVFIGASITAFNSYETVAKDAVRKRFQVRVGWATAGFFAALLSSAGALVSKVASLDVVACIAAVLLLVSFVATGLVAVVTITDLAE